MNDEGLDYAVFAAESNSYTWLCAGGYSLFCAPMLSRSGMFKLSKRDARNALRYW